MSLKHNILIYILVGIFLQPNLLNNLHFVLVSHDFHKDFSDFEKYSIHSRKELHNCEQYFFKVPHATEIDLFEKESVIQSSCFKEISEDSFQTFINNCHISFYRRGPPRQFKHTNQLI